MLINPKIFKAYDIRGIYPAEINESQAYIIARAFIVFLRGKSGRTVPQVILGRDGRLSSPALTASVKQGLLDEGADILDIGLTTTPMFGWVVLSQGVDGGVMVTASHNPKEFNGMKFVERVVGSIGEGNGLKEIYSICESIPTAQKSSGILREASFIYQYAQFLASGFKFNPMRIVLDASNGTTSLVLGEVFKLFPQVATHFLNLDLSGHFPAHGPDPLGPGALDEAATAVVENRFHMGVVFDADGDRVVFIDETGSSVHPDIISALLAQHLLKKKKKAKIVYTVPQSRIVRETILARGGFPVESRVGHFFVTEAMRREHAFLGTEHSGHYFFERMGYSWGGILALLEVMEIVSDLKIKFSSILKPFKKYFSSGEINMPLEIWDRVRGGLPAQFPHAHVSHLDGVTVEYPTWRFNARPSHTERKLRLNMEAVSEDLLKEKLGLVMLIVQK